VRLLAHRPPPSPDGIDGEAGGVVIGPDAYPSCVVGEIVDAIRNSAGKLGINEVVNVDEFGLAGGPRFPSRRS
jgi:hypothetical protein